MNFSGIPGKVSVPFALSGTKNTIPVPSQVGVTDGLASFTTGFPPKTFLPLNAGGVAPYGADFNGILYDITVIQQWQSAGGQFPYDSSFSTAVSGYPKGAFLLRADQTGFWLNLTDGNTTNPDTGGAGWAPVANYGLTAVTGLTNANVTLTALQYAKSTIVLTGTLTGNINIIFPTLQLNWNVVNNTTGGFTVTAKTASGTGVVVVQGTSSIIYGDGTNVQGISTATSNSLGTRFQRFTNNGSLVVPAGITTIYATGCGAGGGGGGASGGPGGGGGGGGAAWCLRLPITVTPGSSLTIAIPGPASGGAPSSGGDTGTAGGSTTINAGGLLTLPGGNGGLGGSVSLNGGSPGSGGTTGSFVGMTGGCQGGITVGGSGGSSLYAGGSPGNAVSGLFGGGGGGGNGSSASGPFSGGAGGQGYLMIEW